MDPASIDLQHLLRTRFGHEAFRPGQELIIRSLLAGRDVLGVLPTGAGKSLVFQLAAQLLPGATLIVSPLISLIKDQVESMEERGLEAGVIHSARTATEAEEDLDRLQRGELKVLYVTPERFGNAAFMARIREIPVSLLVVDEAHCISEWGYDFRPAYLALGSVAKALGRPTLLALTATATPWVRRDILERLGLRNLDVVVRGVDRPSLFLEVQHVEREEEDHRVLRRLFHEPPENYPPDLSGRLFDTMQGSGIIYTTTTRAAEETAEWLREWGIPADAYHGQRRKADRTRIQEAFMEGDLRVIAATTAFGLGVDKPDTRFVIHRDIPASVETYFQEAGRAGRDGRFARCVVIYRPADLGRAAVLSATHQLTRREVRMLRHALRRNPRTSVEELRAATGLAEGTVRRLIHLLESTGTVRQEADRVVMRVQDFSVRAVSLEEEEARKAYEQSRVEMIRSYADLWECRRVYLLNYFGEEPDFEQCGMCDNDCRTDRVGAEPPEAPSPFTAGQRVAHPAWGEGEVAEVDGETVTVRFDRAGEKRLAASLVEARHLLQPLGLAPEPEPPPEPPFHVGDRVVHPEHGPGEVERVTGAAVTVLFDRAGYRTLDREAVESRGLLAPAEEPG